MGEIANKKLIGKHPMLNVNMCNKYTCLEAKCPWRVETMQGVCSSPMNANYPSFQQLYGLYTDMRVRPALLPE